MVVLWQALVCDRTARDGPYWRLNRRGLHPCGAERHVVEREASVPSASHSGQDAAGVGQLLLSLDDPANGRRGLVALLAFGSFLVCIYVLFATLVTVVRNSVVSRMLVGTARGLAGIWFARQFGDHGWAGAAIGVLASQAVMFLRPPLNAAGQAPS